MAIHPNITRAEYDALPGINWSYLKHGIGRTTAHVHAAIRNHRDSPAFKFGRAFHHAVLQPALFEKWEIVDGKTTTRPGAITVAEQEAIQGMACAAHDLGSSDISNRETAITWSFGGVECKGMIDGTMADRVVDLKSTQNASPEAFKGEIFKFKYHAQIAFYMDGLIANGREISGGAILAVEKSDPFAAGLYLLSPSWIELGRTCYEEALEVWTNGTISGYGEQELDVPDWAQPGLVMNEDGGIDV